MSYVKQIMIYNFKACRELSVLLSEYTPLVGYNNSGKTTIIDALNWVIKPCSLDASSFNNAANRLEVRCLLAGIDDNVIRLLGDQHRSRIDPYRVDQEIWFRVTQPRPGAPVREIKREVLTPGRDPNEDASWANPQGFSNAVQPLFPEPIYIRAMEDSAEDIGKVKAGTTIGKLINQLIEPITVAHGENLQQALDEISHLFDAEGHNRSPELSRIDSEATQALNDFFPGINVRIHIPKPSLDQLFKSGTVKLGENGAGFRDIDSFGHGLQRTAQIALVKLLASRGRVVERSNPRVLLLLDEPELYLHPQAIEHLRSSLKFLSNNGYQVVFSTHSPHIISRDDVPSTVLVHKHGHSTSVRSTIRQAVCRVMDDCESQAEALFELTHSSQILFCEKAVLVEGKTERAILPDIYENAHNRTLGMDKIAMVRLDGSGSANKTFRILNELSISTKVLVDLDFAFRHGPQIGILLVSEPLYQDALTEFASLASLHGFELQNGLPKNSSSMTAEEAYYIFSQSERGISIVSNIHERFKTHGYWIWKRGSIEKHLGIVGKNTTVWSSFRSRMKEEGFATAVDDADGVLNALGWLSA